MSEGKPRLKRKPERFCPLLQIFDLPLAALLILSTYGQGVESFPIFEDVVKDPGDFMGRGDHVQLGTKLEQGGHASSRMPVLASGCRITLRQVIATVQVWTRVSLVQGDRQDTGMLEPTAEKDRKSVV